MIITFFVDFFLTKPMMKFLFTILALICLVLAHKSLAEPTDVQPDSVGLLNQFGFSYANCVINCVQPVGKESEEDTIQTRGIMSNYGTLYDCLNKCNTK